MVDESSFSITLPNAPEGKKVSAEEAEKLLVERLEKLHSEFEKSASQLAELYNATGRQAEAIPYLNRLAMSIDDPDRRPNLLTFMDGKSGAEKLITQVLQDPALLQSLASAPKPGADESESK